MWGMSCRCFISSALISSNEHFPSYPQPTSCLKNLPGLSFLSCVSVAGEICHLMSLMGLGKFSLFLLMRKEDSLILPLVRLKSLPSAGWFMRPQSPCHNMKKSWSEGCSRSPKHAVQRSSDLGKCVCVERISWAVCALLRRTYQTSMESALNAYCRARGRLSSDGYAATLHSSQQQHAQSSRSVEQLPC